MKLRRTSGVFFLALGGALGCNAYPTLKNVPIDCTADSAYEFQYIYTFDTTASTTFFGSGDHADPDVSAMPAVQTLTDGDRCGSTTALLLHTEHNDDWGSLFGLYSFGSKDESAYQGLSFWARSPGNTSKAFTILLDDSNTYSAAPAICSLDAGTPATPVDSGSGVCTNYCKPDGGSVGMAYGINPLTGQPTGGATTTAPPPDACGNQYYVVAQVTAGWQFYRFPFTEFQQLPEPNMVGPNGHFTNTGDLAPVTDLVTSALMGLTFRMPPEADMNLWLSHLGFYRKKTGGDGGLDAAKDVRGQ